MAQADTMASDKPRRRRRKEARPGELVEAGLQEFAEKGFAAARLEDIAARAGVSKGTIYLYFSNKEALFQEVVRTHVIPIIDQDEALLEGFEGPTRELIELMIRHMYDNMVRSEMRAIVQIMLGEGPKFPKLTEFYHREVISKGTEVLRRLIQRGVDRGEVSPTAVVDNPMVMVAPVIVACIWKLNFDRIDPMDVDAYISAHMEMVMGWLEADRPIPPAA